MHEGLRSPADLDETTVWAAPEDLTFFLDGFHPRQVVGAVRC